MSSEGFPRTQTYANVFPAEEFMTQELIGYASFWHNTFTNIEDEKPMQIWLGESAKRVRERSFAVVKMAALAGSAPDLIDLGVR